MRLFEWPLPELRLVCATCGHSIEMDTAGLTAIFGDQQDLALLRLDLATGCATHKAATDCQLIYADAKLVDAILETDEEQVLGKELLPQAREWRQKLGMDNSFRKGVA